MNPVPVRDHRPIGWRRGDPALVWLHGGAFVAGGLDQPESEEVGRALADVGVWVRTVDYRLIPDWPSRGPMALTPSSHRYPAPVDDVVDAASQMSEESGGRVAIGGASAGACLAVVAAMRLRATPQAASGLVLAYGFFHPELPADRSRRRSATRELVRRMNLNYAGSEDKLAEALPGGGELRGLPPCLMLDAERDFFRASSDAFATELRTAGVPVDVRVIRGARHGFLDRPHGNAFPLAIAAIGTWLVGSSVR